MTIVDATSFKAHEFKNTIFENANAFDVSDCCVQNVLNPTPY